MRLALYYQLELTRAQIPLLRLGLCIEHLVSMLTCCHHAAKGSRSLDAIADLQALACAKSFLKPVYRGDWEQSIISAVWWLTSVKTFQLEPAPCYTALSRRSSLTTGVSRNAPIDRPPLVSARHTAPAYNHSWATSGSGLFLARQ
ncbi:MAG: hypothetical protein ABI645_02235 [Pseudomonadota bacterium]